MNKNFSTFLEEKHDELLSIINRLKQHYEYVSVLANDCEGKAIKVTNKDISVRDSSWQERGFVIRVFKDGLFSEYSFDNIRDVNVLCERILKATDIEDHLYKAIYVKKIQNIMYEEEKITRTFTKMGEYKDLSLENIIQKCQKIIDNSMEDNEYIISAECNVEFLKVSKMFISSNKDLKQVYAWANASYNCIVNKDEKTKFNYCGESSVSLAEALDKLLLRINNTNIDATNLLDSEKVIPGEYECITSPEISGLIAHEAFGHGVEMDMFVKNRALGQKYMNQKVGSKLVEMHEGAIPFNDVSSYYFDDEGTLAQDTIEIKNGVLVSGVVDAISATKLGVKPTGNGRRESFQRKAYTRMTTTYFTPKNSTLPEMIASIQHGYLIDGEVSGMEDPKNWGIQCIALIGKEIKNGKLTGKVVSPLIMTGNVLDLLNSVSMVSGDFKLFGTGACGKGYKEWVKTSVGGPYMKVKVKLG
jgi:TldD protein